VKYGDDARDRVARILALLEDEDRRWLQDRLAEPWRRRARRLEERDRLIRDCALAYHPLLSGHAMASTIAITIDRYREPWRRFEKDLPAPADPCRGLLWRILHLNNGRSLSARRVRFVLAGVVVVVRPRKSRKRPTGGRRGPGFGLKSGSRRQARGSEDSETVDLRQR
jgi:hypothetical protein